jgi:hypothetical protein
MGHNSTPRRLSTPLIAAGLLAMISGRANAGSMTFLAPREVAVRHNGGSLLRGGIKVINDQEVVVGTARGEKSIALNAVTSVIAADGSFKFYPAQETLDEFLAKSASVRGVTIVRDSAPASTPGGPADPKIASVSSAYAKSIGMQPSGIPQASSSSGGFVQSGGFGGASQRPQALARLDAPSIPEVDPATVAKLEQERKAAQIEAATPKFALPGGSTIATTPPASGSNFALPGKSEEVLICSNPKCRKEVSGAKYGDKCPYCGVTWAAESAAEIAQNGSSAPADPRNPFAKAPAAAQPAVAEAPLAPAPGQVVPAAAQPQGFSLETIPWWGKVLGFISSIVVLMWVLGRR